MHGTVTTGSRPRIQAQTIIQAAPSAHSCDYGYDGEILTVRSRDAYQRVYLEDSGGFPQGWFYPADVVPTSLADEAKTREHLLAESRVTVHQIRERIEAFKRQTENLANFALVRLLEEADARAQEAAGRCAELEEANRAVEAARARDAEGIHVLRGAVATSLDGIAALARAGLGSESAHLAKGLISDASHRQSEASARQEERIASLEAAVEALLARLVNAEPGGVALDEVRQDEFGPVAQPGGSNAETDSHSAQYSPDTAGHDTARVELPPPPATAATAMYLDAAHTGLLRDLGERRAWFRSEVDVLCRRYGLLPDGALDILNEAALDRTGGDPLWEGNDPIRIDPDVAEQMR